MNFSHFSAGNYFKLFHYTTFPARFQFNDLIKHISALIYSAPLEQQTTVSGSGGNNKASNGNSSSSSNSVLHRVITLTTANQGDNNQTGKTPPKPAYVPEKLHFLAYEKFEGENCLIIALIACHKWSEIN